MVGVARAQGPSEERHFGLVGIIQEPFPASNGYSVLLNLKRQGKLTGVVKISVDGNTKFHIPGDNTPTLGEFAVGDHVAVLARAPDGNGVHLAVHMNKSRSKALGPQSLSVFSHQGGTIEAYDFDGAGSVTIKPKKGAAVTHSWGANAVPKIKYKKGVTAPYNGQQAVVVLKRDPATGQFSVKEIQVERGKVKEIQVERGKPKPAK
jgi:hypothetical protein